MRTAQFREASRNFTFNKGTGIPGRVWESTYLEIRMNVQALDKRVFLRKDEAEQSGLFGAVGFPVVSPEGEVVGVLCGFMPWPVNTDENLQMVMNNLPLLENISKHVAMSIVVGG